MAASRKARLPAYRPKSNGDKGKFVDYVSRAGVKSKAIGGEDRHNPLMSVVQVQMGSSRQPRDFNNPPNVIDIFNLNPNIKLIPEGKKWCSVCGEWVKFEGFSPKADTRDGLHPHCKSCRNEHARKMYWLKKEADKQLPMAA